MAQLPADAPKTKAQLSALEYKVKNKDVNAKYTLACCYLSGVDGVVPVSLKKGQKLLKEAADAGHGDACRVLYKLDPLKYMPYQEKALETYKKVGTAEACYHIADLYSADREQCVRWLKTAQLHGYDQAKSDLEAFYRMSNASSYEQWYKNIEPYDIAARAQKKEEVRQMAFDTVDSDIPQASKKKKDLFVVIIGNEKYEEVDNVEFAENDAAVFERYCRMTLGAQPNNIRSYQNLTFARIGSAIRDLKDKVDVNKGNLDVIFFYAGHGIPSEDGKQTYLLPVDADGKDLAACYPLAKLYDELGSLGAKSVVAFIDACFSGSSRNDVALAHNRAPHIRYKTAVPQRRTVVFSAASSGETAWQYKEKQHGLFTYYLLKKLQESKGDCTLGELAAYIESNVGNTSLDVNRKRQTPTVSPSMDIESTWRAFKLK
jgi:hypothetical protein